MRMLYCFAILIFLVSCASSELPPRSAIISDEEDKRASFALFRCVERAAGRLDDGISDARTVTTATKPICSAEFNIVSDYGARNLESPFAISAYHKNDEKMYVGIATTIILSMRSKKNR